MLLLAFSFILILQLQLSTVVCLGVEYDDYSSEEESEYIQIVEEDMTYFVNRRNYARAGVFSRFNEGETLVWPNNTILYKFAPNTTDDFKKRTRTGMDDLQNALKIKIANSTENCLKFKEFTNEDEGKHFTIIYRPADGKGCSSAVGYDLRAKKPYEQYVKLGDRCQPATVIHELTHTLGFYHEHTRNDRDKYICVDLDKVDCEKQHNFIKDADIDTELNTTYYGVPYNYESIMQYSLDTFSTNTSDPAMTHRCNRCGIAWQSDILHTANDMYISNGDLLMIARRYGCIEPKKNETYPVTNSRGRPLKKNDCPQTGRPRKCTSNDVSTCSHT